MLRSLPLLAPGLSENINHGTARDRNLLFAVLALQDDILSRESFVRICKAWADDITQSIAELMQREDLLAPEDRALIEVRMARKLKHHAGDARRSLAESLSGDARQSLGAAPMQTPWPRLSTVRRTPLCNFRAGNGAIA